MCVGVSPPCSKCGAPARWKQMESSSKTAMKRILDIAEFIETLEDECPIKQKLKDIVEGRS